ncbi:hypothetical protein [Streptomyces yaizuensis]|uniref:Uncharacterized protein n=1 Tax=Streptomyces yaizuensis TaxID=2989713 RepID=A0AA86MBI0_9ACTN|nr:hypothetical protein [Streptomyces sp. YSPA8]BDT39548.1 hypothetical protein SYYSPA8_37150 [Streptomyces sp. YSPA8]
MSRYRIDYGSVAEDTLRQMRAPDQFKAAMSRTLGQDPYGHRSKEINGEKDRRHAVIADVLVVYYVSASVLKITAVRLIPSP